MSKRIKHIANLARDKRIIDIGTDHGKLPLILAEDQYVEKILATDISIHSLRKCQESIITDRGRKVINTMVTDGLKGIDTNEWDTIVMAGIGGISIIRILESAFEEGKNIKRLVLAPQKGERDLRLFLHKNGFKIKRDDFLEEEGKYYTILEIVPGKERYDNSRYYKYGLLPIKEKNPVFKAWVLERIKFYKNAFKKTKTNKAREELNEKIKELEIVVDELQN